MATTFLKRHYPLSDGEDHFGGQAQEPRQWSNKKPVVNSPKKKKIKLETNPKPATGVSKGVMVMDPETGDFVMVKESS